MEKEKDLLSLFDEYLHEQEHLIIFLIVELCGFLAGELVRQVAFGHALSRRVLDSSQTKLLRNESDYFSKTSFCRCLSRLAMRIRFTVSW